MTSLVKKRDEMAEQRWKKRFGTATIADDFKAGWNAAVQEFGPLVEAVKEYKKSYGSLDPKNIMSLDARRNRMFKALANLKGESE